ncbi:MAG: preprotein translocase subunit YajC [Sciscionella sp.]|nr:preprotein translocase subunit YajC [Sciscionella sp.]
MQLTQLIFPLLIVVLIVPLFLSARRQKRQVQEQQELQNSLAPGDRVMTTSGLFGTVVDTTDDRIELEIADGVVTTWLRQAVREKVDPNADNDAISGDDDDSAADEHDVIEHEAIDGTDDVDPDAVESGAQLAPPLEHGKKSR